MASIVQKRYRFNLDLDDPTQRSLNEFLGLLDSMAVKERGAWLSRALSFYHDAVISGAVEPVSQNEAHQNLIAQTLAYKSEYFPKSPIGNSENPIVASLALPAAHTQSSPVNTPIQSGLTPPQTESGQGVSSSPSAPPPQETSAATTGPGQDTPMKRRLGAVM